MASLLTQKIVFIFGAEASNFLIDVSLFLFAFLLLIENDSIRQAFIEILSRVDTFCIKLFIDTKRCLLMVLAALI